MTDELLANDRLRFYLRVISTWIPDRAATVLVVGGGENDAAVFHRLGFTSFTLTNVRSAVGRVAAQSRIVAVADAEDLPFADDSFDYTVVHAVLHHCRSPHRALLEMYRVARRAAIFFEARDSVTMRWADAWDLSSPYEITAVEANGGAAGGVADTDIPNYVYRWTEREVEKTISSYAPHVSHKVVYARGYAAPTQCSSRSFATRALKNLLIALHRCVVAFFPSQRNLFACMIAKPRLPADLKPWLVMEGSAVRFRKK